MVQILWPILHVETLKIWNFKMDRVWRYDIPFRFYFSTIDSMEYLKIFELFLWTFPLDMVDSYSSKLSFSFPFNTIFCTFWEIKLTKRTFDINARNKNCSIDNKVRINIHCLDCRYIINVFRPSKIMKRFPVSLQRKG